MQISTKFTIAIHILAAVEYFEKDEKVTSDMLAGSIGANPVIVRGLMSELKKAGLVDTKRGPGGITLAKPLDQISFYDVYMAVEKNKEELFHIHENPNPNCPVGRNIHAALEKDLQEVQDHFENDLKNYKVSDVTNEIHQLVKQQNAQK
ncbi:MAG: Rrf2 family transcriptional regulator [Lactimicrobium sp.]|jgi:Rrf2 family protein|uniref:Rrf2 family transcriptional regulator n=1 Tax=Lactimicrobium sp. TaxID=2563780 RepID=UPI002F35CEBC